MPKMRLTQEWRGNPPGTVLNVTPGQATSIEVLGKGAMVNSAGPAKKATKKP